MKHMGLILLVWLLAQPFEVFAGWQFGQRITITGGAVSETYHHLDGAGRKHVAISGNKVGVLWEDDSSGDPQVYLAIKESAESNFTAAIQVSTGEEAYEPAIAGLASGRFVLVWEQDSAIYLNIHSGGSLRKPLKLSADSALASHSSVTVSDGQIFVVWREHQGSSWSLQVARLSDRENRDSELLSIQSLDTDAMHTPVLYPSLASNKYGLYVAWEDRSAGHTRLKFSFSTDHAASFSEPLYLNEFFSNRTEYDKGSGVTRVSISSFGKDEIVSAWMDKRRGGKGYGIFSSIGSDGSFGPNEKIHGVKGDTLPHYNPATTGNSDGALVVAWDDYRMGDLDIWLASLNEEEEWGQNVSPAPASGPGEQSHASVSLDESGGLHLIWLERENSLAPTQLWYSYGESGKATE
jgi:hypothetical protein